MFRCGFIPEYSIQGYSARSAMSLSIGLSAGFTF